MYFSVQNILAAIAACAGLTVAQACPFPQPLTQSFASQGALKLVDNGGCQIEASLDANASDAALAYASYRRPAYAGPLRFGFRIDLSNFPISSGWKVARLFAASSRNAPAGTEGSALLATVSLIEIADGAHLVFEAADLASPTQRRSKVVTLAQPVAVLRLEFVQADGTNGGVLRYWINAPYSDPPTGALGDVPDIGLDDAAWGAVESVALGLGSASNSFRVSYAGTPMIIHQIESEDSFLFWDQFE